MSDEGTQLKKQQERWQNTKDLMKVKKQNPKLGNLLQTYNSIFDKIEDEYNKTWDEINQLEEQYPYFKETPREIEQRKKELNLKIYKLSQKKQELNKKYYQDVQFFKEDSSKIQKGIEKSEIIPENLPEEKTAKIIDLSSLNKKTTPIDENYLKKIWQEKVSKESPEKQQKIIKNIEQWQKELPGYEPHLDRSNVTHLPNYEELWKIQDDLKKTKELKKPSSDISSLVATKSKPSVLNKTFKLVDLYSNISDIAQGDVLNPAISAAEIGLGMASRLGAPGYFASRFAPALDLLRPTEMEPEDDVTSDIPMKPVRFRKLKQLYNKPE